MSWLAVDALPLSMAKRERADRRKLRSNTADLREVVDKILAPAARLQDAIETFPQPPDLEVASVTSTPSWP